MIRSLTTFVLLLPFLSFPIMAATPSDDAQTVATGLENWEAAKRQCNGNYVYTVQYSSAFGFGHNTEITVQNNTVVRRKYTESSNHPPETGSRSGWTESGSDLGSHDQGAPIKTLDELYAEAAKVVTQPLHADQRCYVKLDKQGLLTSCFYVDTGIADDAPIAGMKVSSIKLNATPTDTNAVGIDDNPGGEAIKNLKPFPAAGDGMRRFVILLPCKERGEDDDFRIELIVGKTMMTDGINRLRPGGKIEKRDLSGWGFDFFEVSEFGPGMSTNISVPPGTPQSETFVSLPPRIERYNSRIPIVVYVPNDGEVRYRIFSAGETKSAELR